MFTVISVEGEMVTLECNGNVFPMKIANEQLRSKFSIGLKHALSKDSDGKFFIEA